MQARFDVRDRQVAPRDVVVVAADGDDHERRSEGGSIPRAVHARLLKRLAEANPEVVANDFQFSGRQPGDERLIAALGAAHPLVLGTAVVTPDGRTPLFGYTGAVEDAGVEVGVAIYVPGPGGVYDRVAETYEPSFSRPCRRRRPSSAGAQWRSGDFGGDGAWIDYAGPPGTVRTTSFADVISTAACRRS